MSIARRSFYMILGFTFPFFWGFHMEGLAGILYRPIQLIAFTESRTWPSFITACLLYIGMIVLVEKLFKREEYASPGLQSLHQEILFDRELLAKDRDTENETVPRYNTAESDEDQKFTQLTELLSRPCREVISEHPYQHSRH